MTDLVLFAVAMLLTGAIGGLLAGLLGIGGGIVIVPVLDTALSLYGTDPAIRMQVAVATSLATIIPTSISSSRAHHRRNSVDIELVRRWAVFVLIGSVAGAFIAAQVHSRVLSLVFAIMAFLIALKMLLPTEGRIFAKEVPRGILMPVVPAFIGTISSMMGIGGGTLSVATLTLLNQSIHRAVGTAALLGLVISLPGTIGYMIAGFGDPRLPPGSLGFVNLIGFALIAPATWLAAPLGAALAHRMSQRQLNLSFGAFLLLVSLRMLGRGF
ncbi:MAG: sulfite exporter TauE/SafE family protein [Gammaproteobacteria bacterium]|nr:sulfite exporter TauE/SafE family protein [Gammaproteobacteria bacterium]MDH4316532.1 sulfite exporter TauE/SafE family protein [Gammaproteobacteria bacterium]MDH5215723.1 sulfite exporter TauE/SafE family protein [Gammaproteobacteria bacterium]